MPKPNLWSTTYHSDTVLLLSLDTPLFIGGADIAATDPVVEGLRVASIRGALRYWARAILSQPSSARLAQIESDIFGSASNPSKLTVKSYWNPKIALSPTDWETVVQGAVASGLTQEEAGLLYLGQVALRKIGNTARQGVFRTEDTRPAEVLLHLGWRGAAKPTPQQGGLVVGALWLLCTFGGSGTRARRGFGAVSVADICDPGIFRDFLDELSFKPQGAEDITNQLSKLAKLAALSSQTKATDAYPNLSCLSAYVSSNDHPSALAAMAEFGHNYQAFRSSIPPKKRIPFGLPILFRGRKPADIFYERRASPLWVRPLRLWDADGKPRRFVLAAAHFKDQFFSSGGRGQQQQVAHGVIDEFLIHKMKMRRVWPPDTRPPESAPPD